jgi:oligoribonuclease NrnB/cAMP/cGMP phosphodiesterase (DHH superfamily)
MTASLNDFADDITGRKVQIIYHGGCPDGCATALILRSALLPHNPSSIELLPTTHGSTHADGVVEDSIVMFADVGPTADDEKKLQKCKWIIGLDHHSSETAIQEQLQETLPHFRNFSNADGSECGATLAQKFCSSQIVPENFLHLFHRLDVWDHTPPTGVMGSYNAFKGFITQGGIGKCTIELVEELLEHTGASLASGIELYRGLAQNTCGIFDKKMLMVTAGDGDRRPPHLYVWAVEFGEDNSKQIDPELYQELIEHHCQPYHDRRPDSMHVWVTLKRARGRKHNYLSVLVRRCGDTLHVGNVCKELKECKRLKFYGGGGHPYAAGAQCSDVNMPASPICLEIASICGKMMDKDSDEWVVVPSSIGAFECLRV